MQVIKTGQVGWPSVRDMAIVATWSSVRRSFESRERALDEGKRRGEGAGPGHGTVRVTSTSSTLRESRYRHSCAPRPSISQPKTRGSGHGRRARGDHAAPTFARGSGRATARSEEARGELVVATRRGSADEPPTALDRTRTDASTQDEIRSSAPRVLFSLAVRR